LESGQTLRTLEGHTKGVGDVAVTPDGRRAVSASDDRTLRLWDLESGQTLRTLEGHTHSVSAVAVTPEGRRAVSASGDETLRLWDLSSGQTLRTLKGHTDSVSAVAVTLDGRRAVSGSFDRTLRLWDLESGKEIATFTGESYVGSCGVTPDGRTIVAGDHLGRMHFLRLVEADKTKLLPGEIKIPLLLRQQKSTEKYENPKQPSIPMLPAQSRAVFISYAHADNESQNRKERWLDRFIEFLQPLVNQENFTLCSDQDIKISDQWHGRIQAQLNATKAVVLLVSPAFLSSSYIRNSELPVILKNAAEQGVRIFPILISPSLFTKAKYKYPDPKTGPQEFTLASLQAANEPSKTLIEMTEGDQNRVLLEVADQLADLLSENPQ
jgi:TIR domain/WD domain, G-beta repeat